MFKVILLFVFLLPVLQRFQFLPEPHIACVAHGVDLAFFFGLQHAAALFFHMVAANKAAIAKIGFELGEGLLQKGSVRIGHAGDAAGQATLFGIGEDLPDHRCLVPVSDGEGIGAASVKVGKQSRAAMTEGNMLSAPEEEIGKAVLTAPGRGFRQNPTVFFPVGKGNPMKIDHFVHVLLAHHSIFFADVQ